MPIPTRSLSLREPQLGHKKSSSLERSASTKQTPTTAASRSSSTSTSSGGSAAEKGRTLRRTSPTENSSSIPTPGFTNKDNSSQRKTLLPQKSLPRREDGQLRQQENRLRETGQAKQQQQDDSAPRIRTQNSDQSGGLRISTKSSIPGSRVTSRIDPPGSPQKREMPTPKSATAPSSQQKTQMPPPARPVRSASLRQPSAASSVSSISSRSHIRTRSQVVGTGTATTIERTTKQAEATPSPLTTTIKPSRPQFSTYQQHFSPKKPAKPPPSPTKASLASEELDPSLIPSSRPDVAALQIELLQLHLFHASSQQTNAEWKASSQKKLQKMYNSVAESYRAGVAEERNHQRQVNCQALSHWFEKIKKSLNREDVTEQIQMLSHVIQEVADLTDSRGGRYTKAVQIFEDWFQKVEQIKRARNPKNHESEKEALLTAEEVDFIDPLDRSWKQEIDLLNAKLELCLRQLQVLDIIGEDATGYPENSALVRIAEGHRALLASMIEELNVMRTIEADVVGSERAWLSQVTDRLQPVDDDEQTKNDGSRTGIWTQF
ncbi:hypothetical protein VTN00DRAFT_7926 [Thermoascus crustaceus]|uniref:uncharacterized protein n=1 Tax=Thermoascus crustaceus TaxID=5088 RepID=UPI00374390C0